MVVGIFIVGLGIGNLYFHLNGWYVALSLVILAFGEMGSSPRIQEYISTIAPQEKVGLYMGYSFLPMAVGNVIGGLLSGSLYASMSDKYHFLRDYLVKHNIAQQDDIAGMDDAILFSQTLSKLDKTSLELNQILYDTYQPGKIWLVFASIGLTTAVLLFLYNSFVMKGNK